MVLRSQIIVVSVSVQLFKCICLFYLFVMLFFMFERQIYLKLVGEFVAVHFQIPINNIILLQPSTFTTRSFCLFIILFLSPSIFLSFCISVILFFCLPALAQQTVLGGTGLWSQFQMVLVHLSSYQVIESRLKSILGLFSSFRAI